MSTYLKSMIRLLKEVELGLVSLLFVIMRRLHKIQYLESSSGNGAKLKMDGLLQYPSTTEIAKFLKDSEYQLSKMFSLGKRVSENPPINQYILRGDELKKFSVLFSEKIRTDLSGAFSVNYAIVYGYLMEYSSHSGPLESSHVWHTDCYLRAVNHHKLFFYLEDCDEKNGAFEHLSLLVSDSLLQSGFISTYPERMRQSEIVTKILESATVHRAEGVAGTGFMFNPSTLIHRAGSTLNYRRRVIVFELMPVPKNAPIYKIGGYKNFLAITSLFEAIKHWL